MHYFFQTLAFFNNPLDLMVLFLEHIELNYCSFTYTIYPI